MARRSMTADHGRLNGDKAVVAFAERVREVRQAVERLWHAPTLEDVYDGAPREACVACRADRAAIVTLTDGRLGIAASSDEHDARRTTDLVSMARHAWPGQPVEFGLMSQSATIVDASLCAPLIHRGCMVGMLVVERVAAQPAFDEFDVEVAAAFAGGIAWALSITDPDLQDEPDDEPDHPDLQALTAREREVFTLLARGASNNAIASALVISESTVKSHVRRVLQKLKVANRTEAAARFHALTGVLGVLSGSRGA